MHKTFFMDRRNFIKNGSLAGLSLTPIAKQSLTFSDKNTVNDSFSIEEISIDAL